MVSLDDPSLLVSYVRNCFITGDDSGFCETLFNSDISIGEPELSSIFQETFQLPIIDTEEEIFSRFSPECPYIDCDDLPLFHSELESASSVPISKPSQPFIEGIRSLTADEVERLFPLTSHSVPATAQLGERKKSSLTAALEQAKADGRLLRSSLFSDFSVHDGRAVDTECAPIPGQRAFQVWFWRVTDFPRTSICVQPCCGTTVRQFIGLTLWQYFNASVPADSSLFDHLDRFDNSFVDRLMLYMLDSPDEDVDSELPPLEPSDPIYKYEFDTLALVERDDSDLFRVSGMETTLLVTVHLAQGISTYRFAANAPLSAVLERVVLRRHLRQHGGLEYHLESWPTANDAVNLRSPAQGQLCPGQKLKLDLRLCDVVAAGLPLRFVLVRDNSRFDPTLVESFGQDDCSEQDTCRSLDQLTPALQLRQYRVTWLKGLSSREVQLDVSPDGIRIDHVNTVRRPKLFAKPIKPVVLDMHQLADCELISSSNSARSSRSSSESGLAVPNRVSLDLSSAPLSPTACVSGKVQLRIVYGAQTSGPAPDISGLDSANTVSYTPVDPQTDSTIVFHHLCLETQWARARTIRDQLILILECCGSRARRLYMQRRLAS